MKNLQLTVVLVTLLCTQLATAQLSQIRNAGSAASAGTAPCGNFAWANTANATGVINDGAFARSTPTVGNNSNCLELATAGFTIPAFATITGIRVDIRRTASRTNVNDINVQLIKAGVKTGTNKATFTNWPQAFTTVTYGGNGDLWGTTWTPAEINAANFGFSFSATRASGTNAANIDVDGIEITVYYNDYSVSGSVFRDYNGNGIRNNAGTFEPGVSGVTVTATLANGTSSSTTTDASGFYFFTQAQVPAASQARLEFSNIPGTDASSAAGSGNGTSVQFVNTANPVTASYGINNPDDYWNNNAQPNPKLLAVVYAHGDINHTNSANSTFGIVQIENNSTGHTPTILNVATQAQVGSVWGMGYQRRNDRYFFGSFLKRHVGFGTRGVGGVYMAEPSGGNYTLTGGFSLQGVVPANSATALDMGSVTRVSTPNTSDFYLATGNDPAGKDMDAFAKAGKVGFGDVEVDEANQRLLLVNLNQRRIVTVDISGGTTTLNNASAATLGPLTNAYNILTLPGVPSCTNGELRPFALKTYKGRGYLGAVCDASATPRDSTNLRGYVLSFDLNNIDAGFTQEISFSFNYRTSSSNGNTNRWHSWADAWSNVTSGGLFRYPEPLISDLEFDENGGINISITDRFGHQMGVAQTIPVAGSATVAGEARISGDILRACRVGGSWVMEGSAGSCTPANTVDNADGFGDGQTVGAYEYYNDESGDNAVGEYTEGAMAKLMGTNLLVQTIVDPNPAPNNTGEPYWYSAGMHWYNINSGSWDNWASLYDGSDAGAPAGTFMKGNGLGDIEFSVAPQPVEVGNRIWFDANGNGIQDADEVTAPVPAGTVVTLRSPGINGIFGDGDDQTWTTTTDANGNYYFSALTSADNRKPSAWTGLGNTLLPGFNYRIEFILPAGYQLTRANVSGNGFDNIDSDALLNGNTAFVVFNTNNINHNFDFGLKTLASLGDKVWRDDDRDGAQDTGEPGVAGVTVTLYSGSTVVATTVTDAYGNYLFDNLVPGSYTVGFTLPANYQFTTQTNTADDTDGSVVKTGGSDVITTTGRTYSITLSAGERELNIDAGLVFAQPNTASVGDRVWYDTNGDGDQDAGETGISGVTVTLLDGSGNVLATTVTDANGNYIFNGLNAGTYSVRFTLPVGFNFTGKDAGGNDDTDSDVNTTGVNFGRTDNFTLNAGENKTNVDAGLVQANAATASLGDKVWNDINQNGIQDAGEPGVPNVTVNLYYDTNGDGVINGAEATTPIATTTTNAFGNYIFNNLSAGRYQIGIVTPLGYTITLQDQGADNARDNDVNAGTARSNIIGLPAGGRNMTLDAGIYQTAPAGTASLGNFVWFDANANGTQDAGEQPVAGVTVTLYTNGVDGIAGTADDAVVNTTATDANGAYQFVNLAAGNYNVGFSNLPVGFNFTPVWASNDANATNSDANPGTGRTGTINLTAGENEPDVDAGLVSGTASGLASLGNKVWYDLNANGIQDAGEAGVPGVTVTLFKDLNGDGDFNDAGENSFATTTTNALGEYLFAGLTAGTYQVRFGTLPAGFTAAAQNSGTDDTRDSDGGVIGGGFSTTGIYQLTTGEENLTVDLGLVEPAALNRLGNYVWYDNGLGGGTANDGIQNGAEQGVAGVTVTLYRDANNDNDLNDAGESTPVAVTTTDANGLYLFSGLADGNYLVQFTNLPAGFWFTGKDVNAENLGTDSDADLISGNTGFIDLDRTSISATRVEDLRVDGGIVSDRAALGNYVWLDANGDGVQDASEAGVAGVTVTLFRPGFGPDGIGGNGDDALPVASMITDQNGQYLFTNLLPGGYEVAFTTLPAGLSFTQQNTPGDNGNNTNSDAGLATGRTALVTLVAGELDATIDAGLFRPRAVIGNYVWADANGNGIQDGTEAGVPGILVTLYNSLGNPVATAVTDANGGYLFPNIGPGTYTLGFANLPNGAVFTVLDQTTGGGNDNNDSDANTGTGRTTSFVVTTTTNNLSFDAGLLNISILPVQLISISAEKINNTAALVKWNIAQAQPGVVFTVERSLNGAAYAAIGTVNGSNVTAYSFTDNQPLLNGKNYYRIRLAEASGRETISEIRWVKFGGGVTVEVYPNPAKGSLYINISETGNNLRYTAELLNINGQRVQTNRLVNGNNRLDVSTLPPAAYQLKVTTGEEVTTHNIIIQ